MPVEIDPMSLELLKYFLSALIGGAVGAALKIGVDEINYRRKKSHTAEEKLHTYAKPFWKASDDLRFRLSVIRDDVMLQNPNERELALKALRWSPKDASSLRWFNEDGQYVVSTAYLIAVFSCWINIFERDVVFLQFKKVSSTTRFFELLEKVKYYLTDIDSILYYNYFSGIGERLIVKDENRPMSIAEFSYRLYQDELFRDYYNQLFSFINWISRGNINGQIQDAVQTLTTLTAFLVENGAIPEMGRKWQPPTAAESEAFKDQAM